MSAETLALRFIAGVVLFGVLAILSLVALAAWLSRPVPDGRCACGCCVDSHDCLSDAMECLTSGCECLGYARASEAA